MIQASLDFESSEINEIFENIFDLPSKLRPTHCSSDENGRGIEICGVKDAIEFLSKNKLGFFLKTRDATYDLTLAGGNIIKIDAYFGAEPALVKNFLAHLALTRPIFGYACMPEERYQRNRLFNRIGVNTIESWVGRDTQKSIPGLYWLTLYRTLWLKRMVYRSRQSGIWLWRTSIFRTANISFAFMIGPKTGNLRRA